MTNNPMNEEKIRTPDDLRRWRWPRLPAGWPLFVLATPASVAIWSGWVGLGQLAGFGVVHPLPGIADGFSLNSSITLPIGVEAYSAYALGTWLSPKPMPRRARIFAGWSAVASLVLGLVGQAFYHLLSTWAYKTAPTPIVVGVACLPVLVLGAAAALHHLMRTDPTQPAPAASDATEGVAPAAQPGELAPTAPKAPALTGTAPETGRAARRRARRKTGRGPRLLKADYLAMARAALSSDTEPSTAWVRQVTGCARTTAVEIAKTLRAELPAAARPGPMPELPAGRPTPTTPADAPVQADQHHNEKQEVAT